MLLEGYSVVNYRFSYSLLISFIGQVNFFWEISGDFFEFQKFLQIVLYEKLIKRVVSGYDVFIYDLVKEEGNIF